MFISNSSLALWIINRYKSEWEKVNVSNKSEIGSEERELNYALRTVSLESKKGIGVEVLDKNVMEIGSGRGGISLCIAMNGASKVTGIDISDEAIETAEKIKKTFENKGLVRPGIVEFKKEKVENMSFADETFDIIIADNVLEHVEDLDATIKECGRVLKKGGYFYIPNFPPIYSRNGPHLKYGAKVPWLHIFFTEKAICEAIYKRAVKYPELKLFDWYPGLSKHPTTFKDIRRYRDLNYITNNKFKKAVAKSNLVLVKFHSKRSAFQKLIVFILPFLKRTVFGDILSYGTMATVRKRKNYSAKLSV